MRQCCGATTSLFWWKLAGELRLRVLLMVSVALMAGCSGEVDVADGSPVGTNLSEEAPAQLDFERPRRVPLYSSPIVLSRDDTLLWSVNPDTNSVSVASTGDNTLIAKFAVGDNPQSVAVDPANRYAYIANSGSNDVSVIDVRHLLEARPGPGVRQRRLVTGGAPASVLIAPNGNRVFVANGSQDTITVLSGHDQRVLEVVDLRDSACNADDRSRHFQPRAMAITADGRRLYVTRFLSHTRPGGVQRADFGKEGMVCRIDLDPESFGTTRRTTPIRLAPSDAGFLDQKGNLTGAFPNQLQSIVIRDNHAYLPNIAASPSGPLHFDVDTQAYVNRIDRLEGNESDGGALNLHLGARQPPAGRRQLYFANPRAIAFSSQSGEGAAYVVAAGSDVIVKLRVDSTGGLHFTDGEQTTRYIDLNDPDAAETSGPNAGKNPIGIVINARATKAYVLNYVSRNVSVVDLTTDTVQTVFTVEQLPPPGSHEEQVLVGAELFFSSRGAFVRPPGATGSSRDRLSENGHQSCASCHPGGLTDGVVWQFASGPRKTLPINGTTNPRDHTKQRIINASAIFDELEDVDFNTRRVSSGEPLSTPKVCVDALPPTGTVSSTNDPDHGLILGMENDFSMAPCVLVPFRTPNENRPQLRVQLPGSNVQVKATDALKEWQRTAVRTPSRALTETELADAGFSIAAASSARLREGRNLFEAAGCPTCHGGDQWTRRVKDFTSPPADSEIATETATGANNSQYLHRFLTDVGTFALNVSGSDNSMPNFPAIGGIEKDTNELNALGFDYDGDGKGSGYNTPSLLGSFSVPPYFHNGACESYICVLANVKHRRAGQANGQIDPLDDPVARQTLSSYLESIDLSTQPHGE